MQPGDHKSGYHITKFLWNDRRYLINQISVLYIICYKSSILFGYNRRIGDSLRTDPHKTCGVFHGNIAKKRAKR